MEHLHVDVVVVALELVVDVVRRRRAHDACGFLGGRPEDDDGAAWYLHRVAALKICDLNVAALRMMKGK